MDRQETSKSLYFPERLITKKNIMVNLLLDIDCNLSKFICMLLDEIIKASKMIKEKKQHFRMYNWRIVLELREEYKDNANNGS